MTDIKDHRGENATTDTHTHTQHEHSPPEVFVDHRPTAIKHIFVLMMENRSFDHMLGWSGITGTDARTGEPTTIRGLDGTQACEWKGGTYHVRRGAPDRALRPVGHDFDDVIEQLCGPDAKDFASGHSYPPAGASLTMRGFVSSYAGKTPYNDEVPGEPHDVMGCFTPDQLPVLTALAKEFAVCDNWFCSLPGPTWPNRMFAHAATSGEYDDGPQDFSIPVIGNPTEPFLLLGGAKAKTIFDALRDANMEFRIYADDHMPNVMELQSITVDDILEFEDLARDLQDPSFAAKYIFIEPSYDVPGGFADGNSQHPRGSVAAGEAFIKAAYEAIRNSPVWEHSLLIITYDEHGGFYDHVPPPAAVRVAPKGKYNGFMWDRLGPRVPAIVVSPLVPKHLIEHRLLEHTAIPATVERVFGLPAITQRDAHGNGVNHLATLKTARTDTPTHLPAVASPWKPRPSVASKTSPDPAALIANDKSGNSQSTLRIAVRQHLQIAPPQEHEAIRARAQTIKTQGQLLAYVQELEPKIKAQRARVRDHRVHV